MNFSQYAGTAIIPTLSRLVLCVAFFSAGFNKVFKEGEFNAEQATRLKALGVNVTPAGAAAAWNHPGEDANAGSGGVELVSYRQDSTPATTAPVAPPTSEPAFVEPPKKGEPASHAKPPAATGALPDGKYFASRMHNITLMVDEAKWPSPVWMARLAAFTELFGGALLLIGLFSRVWGLGLAIAMGVAFYLTTVQHTDVLHQMPWTFAEDIGKFNTMYAQLGLLVLAFGVFLTGPGPLSVDRILFAKDEDLPPVEHKPTDAPKA